MDNYLQHGILLKVGDDSNQLPDRFHHPTGETRKKRDYVFLLGSVGSSCIGDTTEGHLDVE